MIVDSSHSDFERMFRAWRREGGSHLEFNGQVWLVIEDNDEIRFSLKSDSAPWHFYEDQASSKAIRTDKRS